jgi:RNA polymerase sigma-70 factor (ECF subfamily)
MLKRAIDRQTGDKAADAQRSAAESASEIASRRAAYTRLLCQHEAALLRAARRICGRREDLAQDLLQEALVRGYEAFLAGRFQEGTNARAWLLRILTNLYINDYRREQKWNAGIDMETLTAQGDICPEALQAGVSQKPEAALLEKTLDEPLEQALGALAEEVRLCVVLVDIEGMEYAETAALLGIPIGTVRSRLSRARATLHTLLYDYAQERRRV